MKHTFLFLAIILYSIVLSISSCKKKHQDCEGSVYSKGYIIGFNPCTALSSGEKGYVIKFDNNNDTLVAYFTLPNNITIPANLYSNYVSDFLFPVGFRDTYIIEATYHQASAAEEKIFFCNGLINLLDFTRATKGKQTIIDCIKN